MSLFSLTSSPLFNNSKLFFSRKELGKILSCYSLGVTNGNWKDYSINSKKDEASFFIYRHSHTLPDCILTKSNSNLIYKSLPENDPVRRQPDITLAKKMLGWEPTVELNEGLGYVINYFSKMNSLTTSDKKPERIQKYFKKTVPESA